MIPQILGVVALVVISYLALRGCSSDKTKEAVQKAKETVVDSSKLKAAADSLAKLPQVAIHKIGELFSRKVGEVNLNIAYGGIEDSLIAFIENANRPVDKTTWFSFDRLYFQTGKATLESRSEEQLNNIAAILKVYPNVDLKIGGYSDNVGKEKSNQKLSQVRAETTMKELIKRGVAKNRLKAEGYGSQFPVASNDTDEGRAKNRRIDVRVTKK
jgi:outer membrane protein OmpA-like peptidoglycan-associated protein